MWIGLQVVEFPGVNVVAVEAGELVAVVAHSVMRARRVEARIFVIMIVDGLAPVRGCAPAEQRSEEHTSELQSLMRISYAVFWFKKKKTTHTKQHYVNIQLHITISVIQDKHQKHARILCTVIKQKLRNAYLHNTPKYNHLHQHIKHNSRSNNSYIHIDI